MNKQKSVTQKVQSVRPRGGATKAVLMRHALKMFAEKGFSATGTRDLASIADVNQAAITYHFVNKEGLFQAVCEWVTTCLTTELMPVFNSYEKEISKIRDGSQELKDKAVHTLLSGLFDIFWNDNNIHTEIMLFKREIAAQPSADFYLRKQLYDPTMARLQNAITQYNPEIKDQKCYFTASIIMDALLSFNTNIASFNKVFGSRSVSNIKKRKELSVIIINILMLTLKKE